MVPHILAILAARPIKRMSVPPASWCEPKRKEVPVDHNVPVFAAGFCLAA